MERYQLIERKDGWKDELYKVLNNLKFDLRDIAKILEVLERTTYFQKIYVGTQAPREGEVENEVFIKETEFDSMLENSFVYVNEKFTAIWLEPLISA